MAVASSFKAVEVVREWCLTQQIVAYDASGALEIARVGKPASQGLPVCHRQYAAVAAAVLQLHFGHLHSLGAHTATCSRICAIRGRIGACLHEAMHHHMGRAFPRGE
jgi:hypothetical protein